MNAGKTRSLPRQFHQRLITIPALSIIALMFTGCSKSTLYVDVTGYVYVDTEPAKGAVVLFHPENDSKGMTASGIVGEGGMFTLSSGLKKGVATGSYRVTIIWPDPSKQPTPIEMMSGNSSDVPDLLQGRYSNRDGSTLKVTVDAKTTEISDFDLKRP